MTAHRPRRVDPETGRRWFIRASATRADRHHADLAHLLGALSAPARPEELAGEEAAVEFFRTTHPHLRPPEPSRPVRRTAAGRLVALKVAAAVVAATVTATGAVSVAATNGILRNPLGGGSHHATPDRHPAVNPSQDPDPDADRDATPSGPAPGESTETLVGLCRTYRSAEADHPGRPPEEPAFAVLIAAAGGRNKVAAYCGTLLNLPTGGGASPGPAPTGPASPAVPEFANPAPTPPETTGPVATPTGQADPTPRPSHPTPSAGPHGGTKPSKSVPAVPKIIPSGSSGSQQGDRS